MALTVDRHAFIDTLTQGKGDIGGAMLPPPEGIWGMPPEMAKQLPGYDPDVEKNRAEARKLMEKNGYGPNKRLALKVSTRNIPPYRDPAVILIDQLKQIYIDAELEPVDSPAWFPKVARKDFTIGLNLTGYGIDDPDQTFYENFACGSENNYDGYCNPEIDKLFDQQSMPSRTRRSASSWSGRSSSGWPRTWRGRCCTTTAPAPAGTPTSRATCRWSTASTTATAWKRSGSTSSASAATKGCMTGSHFAVF